MIPESNLNNDGLFEAIEKEIEEESPYCEHCGACGEDGCCPPTRCEAVKCKYGPGYIEDYKRMQTQWEVMFKGLTKLKEAGNETATEVLNELDKSW
jgi:hypothetical protein